jgi:hypothetical protein
VETFAATLSFEVALSLACVLAAVVEVGLGDDTKGADGREHPAFRAVDLVHVIAFSDRPALASARQVEVPGEHVARIALAGLIAVADSATASTASIAEVVAVATVREARIVSVPHDRLFVVEHHEIVVTLATLLLSMRTLEGCRNRPSGRLRMKRVVSVLLCTERPVKVGRSERIGFSLSLRGRSVWLAGPKIQSL